MTGLVEQLSKQIDNHKVVIKNSKEGIELCDRIINKLQNMKLTSNIFQNSIKNNSEVGQLEQKKCCFENISV